MMKDGFNLHQARILGRILSLLVMVVPMICLAGWITGNQLVASFGGRYIPMAPSSAISFVFIALSLFFGLGNVQIQQKNIGIEIIGCLVGLYSLYIFSGWLVGFPTNPEAWLVKEMGRIGTFQIGRMSPVAGLLFLLSSITIITFFRRKSEKSTSQWEFYVAGILGLVVFLTGGLFSLGYTVGNPLLYESGVIPLALPTSISFLITGLVFVIILVLYNPISNRWYQRLNEMKIGLQLNFGLGVMLSIVFLLAALAWIQKDSMWQQTKVLYEQPFMARRALGELKADILFMQWGMKDIYLTADNCERENLIIQMGKYKKDADKKLQIIWQTYHGLINDIDFAIIDFAEWQSTREKTFRTIGEGKIKGANPRTKATGPGEKYLTSLLEHLNAIDSYSKKTGDQLYSKSIALRDSLNRQLIFLVVFILIITQVIISVLKKNIRIPLEELTSLTTQFGAGQLNVRNNYRSQNEFGLLAGSFNKLAERIETEMIFNEQSVKLNAVMLTTLEERGFHLHVLDTLMQLTGSQGGCIYLFNSEQNKFLFLETIGFEPSACTSFSALDFEGEFGSTIITRKIQHITNIPAATRFVFTDENMGIRPVSIIIIPLISEHEIIAIITLASINHYDPNALRLITDRQSLLTSWMNSMLANQRIAEMTMSLEKQNNALDEANKQKTIFLSNMSHELRTPLNSVIALSGVLSRRLAGKIGSEEYSYLEVIERNGQQLLNQIDAILDIARIDTGHSIPDISTFDFNDLVDEIIDLIAPVAEQKSIQFIFNHPPNPSKINSDRDKCKHILQNIIGNAVKFTERGNVQITTKKNQDNIEVVVKDNGVGIEEKYLPYIFDEFRQADSSITKKYGGTGLGLSIAKKYAVMLNGNITVKSETGKGSCFILSLPLIQSTATLINNLPD